MSGSGDARALLRSVWASAGFAVLSLRVPARLLAEALREVLTMSAVPEIRDAVEAQVRAVQRDYRFAEAFLRAGKVGGRLDVQVDFVVDDSSTAQTVREFDRVRADLDQRLRSLGYAVSLGVGFTADRRWAA